MKRANVLGAALVVAGTLTMATPAAAQVTVGADFGLFSSYVWRGLSLTNKPVAEPDLYVSFPVGAASITLGGWANIDLGKYDDLDNDISQSGALSAFNFAEFDPYVELSYPAGKVTLTGGAIAYIYPNTVGSAPNVNDFGLATSDDNTVEIYGRLEVDSPLNPHLSVYYDVDKIKGAYFEGGVSQSFPVSGTLGIELGALAGVSAGQGISDNADESSNFDDDGFTHLDLSAGLPLTAGNVSITPVLHLVIAGDDCVKIASPTKTHDTKLWGGVSIGWSKDYGAAAQEAGSE
ncbi:MAG: hypothetical protein ABIY46_09730 [Gemmatimonadales bacterium]